MLGKAVERIAKGIMVNGSKVYGKLSRGRFPEEVNIDTFAEEKNSSELLLTVKVFYGKKPYYKPWVELFNIDRSYFNSRIEKEMLSLFSRHLKGGEKIFVEYNNDEETKRELESGVPAQITRLGFLLFSLGFTWFKDWYFAEGFMEGNIKLQAEKPLNGRERARQLKNIVGETRAFVGRKEIENEKISKRAREILKQYS